jgi:predicted RNA polymerase sigma factor
VSAAAAGHNRIHRAIDAVWRIESAKVIAAVALMLGDVGVAEVGSPIEKTG